MMQSDGNNLEIDTFQEAITSEPMIILKTPTRPYSCLANFVLFFHASYKLWCISCRLMKSISFRTVPI